MIMHHSNSGSRLVLTRLLTLVGGAVLVLGATGGCREDPAIKPVNQIPIADARIIRNGESVNARMEGGAGALSFDYTGMPITITLDASNSYDPDGTIVAYHWLSATLAPDGGIQLPDEGGVSLRWIPPGVSLNWPGDQVKPQVTLGQGSWSFDLWVTDNLGAISNPDTITITIGNVVSPEVQQCADAVLSTEPESCRLCVCKQSAMCRAAAVMTACGQSCWDLINCLAAHCPDFTAMAAKMDYSCLTMNCSAFLSGSTGATPVGPCFNACTTECAGAGGDGGAGAGDGGGAEGGGNGDAGTNSATDGAPGDARAD
jgi:hypothetical protein